MFHSSTEAEKSIKELGFFNGFELYVYWNFSDVAILVPKICSTSLYAWVIMGSFGDETYKSGYVPQLD